MEEPVLNRVAEKQRKGESREVFCKISDAKVGLATGAHVGLALSQLGRMLILVSAVQT